MFGSRISDLDNEDDMRAFRDMGVLEEEEEEEAEKEEGENFRSLTNALSAHFSARNKRLPCKKYSRRIKWLELPQKDAKLPDYIVDFCRDCRIRLLIPIEEEEKFDSLVGDGDCLYCNSCAQRILEELSTEYNLKKREMRRLVTKSSRSFQEAFTSPSQEEKNKFMEQENDNITTEETSLRCYRSNLLNDHVPRLLTLAFRFFGTRGYFQNRHQNIGFDFEGFLNCYRKNEFDEAIMKGVEEIFSDYFLSFHCLNEIFRLWNFNHFVTMNDLILNYNDHQTENFWINVYDSFFELHANSNIFSWERENMILGPIEKMEKPSFEFNSVMMIYLIKKQEELLRSSSSSSSASRLNSQDMFLNLDSFPRVEEDKASLKCNSGHLYKGSSSDKLINEEKESYDIQNGGFGYLFLCVLRILQKYLKCVDEDDTSFIILTRKQKGVQREKKHVSKNMQISETFRQYNEAKQKSENGISENLGVSSPNSSEIKETEEIEISGNEKTGKQSVETKASIQKVQASRKQFSDSFVFPASPSPSPRSSNMNTSSLSLQFMELADDYKMKTPNQKKLNSSIPKRTFHIKKFDYFDNEVEEEEEEEEGAAVEMVLNGSFSYFVVKTFQLVKLKSKLLDAKKVKYLVKFEKKGKKHNFFLTKKSGGIKKFRKSVEFFSQIIMSITNLMREKYRNEIYIPFAMFKYKERLLICTPSSCSSSTSKNNENLNSVDRYYNIEFSGVKKNYQNYQKSWKMLLINLKWCIIQM